MRSREMRAGAAVALVLALVFGGLLALSYLRDRPLRRDDLVSAQAAVLEMDFHYRRADEVVVRFVAADDAQVEAHIPVRQTYKAGDFVRVLYDASDPSRVRTAIGWQPASSLLLVPTIMLSIFALLFWCASVLVGVERPTSDDGAALRVRGERGARRPGRSGRRGRPGRRG